MLIKSPADIPSSEITPQSVYKNRREFMGAGVKLALGLAGGAVLPSSIQAAADDGLRARAPSEMKRAAPAPSWLNEKLARTSKVPDSGPYYTDEKLTSYRDITTHNNFYEFGTAKGDPQKHSRSFKVDPWSIEISGEVTKPGVYNLEDILKPHALEERIYRLRCVEAWSMVIPWVGFPLADLIKRFEPTSKAKYVEFLTLVDRDQMPAQSSRFATIDWPYREGLRIDEAMNPLTFMAMGLYGEVLPPQNGAPIRLVVPWKYGFKSIKSIVKINFRETMPNTTWNDLQASEYGFYANVNPNVSHPRWSQASESRFPLPLFGGRRNHETEMFNGYGEQVASLYRNMNLAKFF